MFAKEYHIKLGKEDTGKYVLMPGSPERVKKIAEKLGNSVYLGSNREYTTYAGYLEGERVTVISSGIGGPSTAIAVEELHRTGVHTIIRIGTCGTLHPHIANGSLIIPYGVVRGGKTAEEYIPASYPAVPHPDVFQALLQSVNKANYSFYAGITHCKDAFFKEEPDMMPDTEKVKNYWKMMRKANVLSSEMESDTLFVLASLRGIRAGAIFSAIGSVEGVPIRKIAGINLAIETAVEALRIIIKDDLEANSENSDNVNIATY